MGHHHQSRPALITREHELIIKRRVEPLDLPITPAILIEHGIEHEIGAGQGVAVDPFESRDAEDSQRARHEIQSLDRVIVDQKQGEDGDMNRDEELPEKIDLAPCRHNGFDQRAFVQWRHATFLHPERCQGRRKSLLYKEQLCGRQLPLPVRISRP